MLKLKQEYLLSKEMKNKDDWTKKTQAIRVTKEKMTLK